MSVSNQMGPIADLIESQTSGVERAELRRRYADAVGSVYASLMRPLEIEFPKLLDEFGD
jgi:hypothetical protein